MYTYLSTSGDHCQIRINTDGNIQIGDSGEWSIKLEEDEIFSHGVLTSENTFSLSDGQSYTIGDVASKTSLATTRDIANMATTNTDQTLENKTLSLPVIANLKQADDGGIINMPTVASGSTVTLATMNDLLNVHLYNLSSLMSDAGTYDKFFIKVYENSNVAGITMTWLTNTASNTIFSAGILYALGATNRIIYGENYSAGTSYIPTLTIPTSSNASTTFTTGSTSGNVCYSIHGYIYGFTRLSISSNAIQLF